MLTNVFPRRSQISLEERCQKKYRANKLAQKFLENNGSNVKILYKNIKIEIKPWKTTTCKWIEGKLELRHFKFYVILRMMIKMPSYFKLYYITYAH